MDAMGHVNNIMYFRYFEQTRLEWYEQAGYTMPSSKKSDESDSGLEEGMVIVDNHAEYIKPLVYPMQVAIRMCGHSPGRSSFITTYELTVEGVVYTRGSSKVVWINVATGKSIPLPETLRTMLAAE